MLVITDHKKREFKTWYDDLNLGIVLVMEDLDIIFMNIWFLQRLPEKLKQLWKSGTPFNLKILFDPGENNQIEQVIHKAVKYRSVHMLSQAFHDWMIPLHDHRFADGRMRQTCIVKCHGSLQPVDFEPDSCSLCGEKKLAIIQIKDESDTVLRIANLRRSSENIKEKRNKLEDANRKLDCLNRELVQLNLELKQREAYVKQKSKMEAMGLMAGGVAHDFNNYLAIILGNTELLMEDLSVNEPSYEILEEMQKASLNARDIIRQILLFSRPEWEEEYTEASLNLNEFIRSQLPLIKSMMPRSIVLDYRYNGSNGGMVCATMSQIQRILLNLILNASYAICGFSGYSVGQLTGKKPSDSTSTSVPVNASSQKKFFQNKESLKSGNISIVVEHIDIESAADQVDLNSLILTDQYDLIPSGKYVTMTIHDNGHGIPAEDIEKLFDPYFTTKPIGDGSGIGLSVVHGIVKHLKGFIRVKSEVNMGSSFTVFLPDTLS